VRGYLSYITAKVTATRPAVRPRVPSLFEPVKGVQFLNVQNMAAERRDAASTQEPGGLEQDRFVDAVPGATTPASRKLGQLPRTNKSDLTLKDADNSGAVSRRNELRRTEDRPKPVKAVATQAEIEPALDVQHAETTAHREPLQPQVANRPRQSKTREQSPARIEVTIPQSENRTTKIEVEQVGREAVRTARDRDDGDRDHEHIRPAIDRDTSRRREPPPILVSQIAPVSQPAPRERTAAVREIVNEAPPPVQVTIGRLIVEAVMPPGAPAPAPIRRAPGPRLSLEDYLRQRGGRA
jgi:hypothetical protein